MGVVKRALSAAVVAAALVAACTSAAPVASPVSSAPPTAPVTPSPTASPTPSPAPSATLGFVPGTKASPRTVKITADDELTFFPNVITVAGGETVSFAITNAGKAAHEFMLGPAADAIADTEGTREVADILVGETKSLIFSFE